MADPTSLDGAPVQPGTISKKPNGLRFLLTVVGWVVGSATAFMGALVFAESDWPPTKAMAAVVVVAGAAVLPPVTATLRKQAAILRPWWVPPLAYLGLVCIVGPLVGPAVEPHGAARQAYIDKAIVAAEADLRAHQISLAESELSAFEGDTAKSPALRALLARVDAETAKQQPPANAVVASQTAAAQPPPPPPAPSGPTPVEIAAFKSDMQRLFGMMKPCDDSVLNSEDVSKKGDPYEDYPALKDAESACAGAFEQISTFSFSQQISSPRRDALNGIRDTCANAYLMKEAQMTAIAVVVNGDTSPAKVSDAQEAGTAATSDMTACAANVLVSASKAGFDTKLAVPPEAAKSGGDG